MGRVLLLLGLLSACGDKQGPKPQPGIDKRGIQERSDSVHNDLKDEEDRDRRRKEQQ